MNRKQFIIVVLLMIFSFISGAIVLRIYGNNLISGVKETNHVLDDSNNPEPTPTPDIPYEPTPSPIPTIVKSSLDKQIKLTPRMEEIIQQYKAEEVNLQQKINDSTVLADSICTKKDQDIASAIECSEQRRYILTLEESLGRHRTNYAAVLLIASGDEDGAERMIQNQRDYDLLETLNEIKLELNK